MVYSRGPLQFLFCLLPTKLSFSTTGFNTCFRLEQPQYLLNTKHFTQEHRTIPRAVHSIHHSVHSLLQPFEYPYLIYFDHPFCAFFMPFLYVLKEVIFQSKMRTRINVMCKWNKCSETQADSYVDFLLTMSVIDFFYTFFMKNRRMNLVAPD